MLVAMKWSLGALVGFLSSILLPAISLQAVLAEATNPTPSVIISELKLGGDSYSNGTDQPKDPQEFISLFNQSSSPVNLDGWLLEYAKTTFDKTYCSSTNWTSHGVSNSASATKLSGTLQPNQVSIPIVRALTDNAAGSLHLVNMSDANNPSVLDLVGWGANAPCFENTSTVTPSNGKSIKRYLDCINNLPIDTNNNALDFASGQPPSPGVLENPYITTCQENTATVQVPSAQPTCEGTIISELLPNPSGTDTSHEFIELYNPTAEIISLAGCSLQTTANSKVYNFGNVSLQPGQYHAIYDNESGLTLSNNTGGTVWLLSLNTELQTVNYPGNLDDDVAFALADSTWQNTYVPTPNFANIIESLKPCPAGQARNPDTNRCNNVTSDSNTSLSPLAPCKEGQERSADTNRCRNIVVASPKSSKTSKFTSSLTPCKPGQERNPATNRCKSIVTTVSAALKPCTAGQERNPSTNRCRKTMTSSTAGKLSAVKDNVSGSISSSPHWWLAGFAAVGATSYGAYEWRQEVIQFFGRLRSRLLKK
jgi:hypothetical protein